MNVTSTPTAAIEFVPIAVAVGDDQQVQTMGQRTACPHLFITTEIKQTIPGDWEIFGGRSALTHAPTGRRVVYRECDDQSLLELAERLALFDWSFTDPAAAAAADWYPEAVAVIRDWQMSYAVTPTTHFYGEPDEAKADRERDPAGSWLREHVAWWQKHWQFYTGKEANLWPDNKEAFNAHSSLSVEAYIGIYLLAVLRRTDPQVADIAARELVAELATDDSLGERIHQWRNELAAGQPLSLPGIPDTNQLAPLTEAAVIDAAHINRQREFSEQTFGPGMRTAGVLDHIAKELDEVRDAPHDVSEWADIIILAIDGAWRAGCGAQEVIDAVHSKQARNEARTWPDWRTAEPGKAIEHDRTVAE